jgi:hypothetical protein
MLNEVVAVVVGADCVFSRDALSILIALTPAVTD